MTSNLKQLMLQASLEAAKHESSCMSCTENYCCRMQKRIEVARKEWERLIPLITDEQEERMIEQVEIYKKHGYFDCPFNNPETKKCEIYDDRPYVCAGYQVKNPKEDCDSRTKKDIAVLNPMTTIKIIMSDMDKYHELIQDMANMVSDDEEWGMNLIEGVMEYIDERKV